MWSVRLLLLESFFFNIASRAGQFIYVNSGMCMSRVVISHKYVCANELKNEVQNFCVLIYLEPLTSPFASM
jgi:hypothetical protein